MYAPPTFGDVTGDGVLDVVSVVGNPLNAGTTVEGLYAYEANGFELQDGDSVASSYGVLRAHAFGATHTRQPVTLGELDDVPGDEILYFAGNSVHAITGSGHDVPGWPLHFTTSTEAYTSAPIMVADVDGDFREDVIFTSGYEAAGEFSKLHVVDRYGAALPGWPVTLPRDSFGIRVYNSVVGNFDDDDELEIIVASTPTTPVVPRKIVMFDHRGARVWSRSIAAHDMVAGDVDGDGRLELVVLERPRVEAGKWVVRLIVLTGDGGRHADFVIDIGPYIHRTTTATIAGMPNTLVRRESHAYTGAHNSNEHYPDVLFLGTVDDGPTLEAVFSVRFLDMEVYGELSEVQYPTIFEHWGATFAIDLRAMRVLPGFPLEHPYVEGLLATPQGRFISADRLIDIDGDGRQEIVTSEHEASALGTDEVTLRFWDGLGVELIEHDIHAWTPSTGFVLEPILRRLTFGDLDQDGRLDLGINMRRGELHIEGLLFPVDATSTHPHGCWPVARQNTRRTGVLGGL